MRKGRSIFSVALVLSRSYPRERIERTVDVIDYSLNTVFGLSSFAPVIIQERRRSSKELQHADYTTLSGSCPLLLF